MTQQLTTIRPNYEGLLPTPTEWQTMMQIAETVVKSGLAPTEVNTPQKALIIMLKARELGVPPMQALSTIHVVKGKPTLAADLMVGLLRREGHRVWVVKTTGQDCVMKGHRKGESEHTIEVVFTIEDAAKAGLTGKETWKQYTPQLLYARCASRISRMIAPDVLAGMYTAEEMGAEVAYENDEEIVISPAQAQPQAQQPAQEVVIVPSVKPTAPRPAIPRNQQKVEEAQPAKANGHHRLSPDEFRAELAKMGKDPVDVCELYQVEKVNDIIKREAFAKLPDPMRALLYEYVVAVRNLNFEFPFTWDKESDLPVALEPELIPFGANS